MKLDVCFGFLYCSFVLLFVSITRFYFTNITTQPNPDPNPDGNSNPNLSLLQQVYRKARPERGFVYIYLIPGTIFVCMGGVHKM